MRLDRLITLGFVAPFQRLREAESDCRLPILMYHSISDEAEQGISPYYQVCTSPRRLDEQMAWLAAAGWRGCTLSEGLAALKGHSVKGEKPEASSSAIPLPLSTNPINPKLVAITFDDGFRDFHTAAFPILRRYGFSATMYLPTAFIGEERKSFLSRECLTWSEVRDLTQAGIEFGSHSVNHPKLIELAWSAIETELRDSKATIEIKLGRPCASFAYPFAFPEANRAFATQFRELLAASGYENAVTTVIGRAQTGNNALQLSRLPVNSLDDIALFEAKVYGAYDWLSYFQRTSKFLRKAVSKRTVI